MPDPLTPAAAASASPTAAHRAALDGAPTLPPLWPAGLAVVAWMSAWAVLLWWAASPRDAVAALVCGTPALLAAALTLSSPAERSAYLIRLLACGLMLPVLQLMLADGQDWPVTGLRLLALAGVHLVCLLAALAWAASATTALPALGAMQPEHLLARRLQALPGRVRTPWPSWSLGVRPATDASGGHWIVELPASQGRAHQVLLVFDPARRQVRVRERTAADDARPQDAAEASLHRPGDPLLDPGRPQARRVWSRSAQATTLEAAQLAAVELGFDGAGELASARIAALPAFEADHGRAGVALLAALVTRSGWAWRPRLFGR
jgi:hypothetical protein